MTFGISVFSDNIKAGIENQQQIVNKALLDAEQNQEVITILGDPIESSGSKDSSNSIDNRIRYSTYSIPIIGSKGTGTIRIITHQKGEETMYDLYTVTINSSNETIDLKDALE